MFLYTTDKVSEDYFSFFPPTVLPRILILSRLLFIQLNAQLDCSRKLLRLALKFTLKCSSMFRFNNHPQGDYSCALLKL